METCQPKPERSPVALSMRGARNTLYHAYAFPVFHPRECDTIICAAERQAETTGWTEKRHKNFPTCDQPLDHVVRIAPDVRARITACILARIPALFGFSSARVVERDLFIVKYDATSSRGQRELEIHRDGSLLTFNIALSHPHDFVGGGTMLEPLGVVVRPAQGVCLIHSGHWRHAGHPIAAGQRYILVGFIDISDARVRPFSRVLEMHRTMAATVGPFTDRWVLDHVFSAAGPSRWFRASPAPGSDRLAAADAGGPTKSLPRRTGPLGSTARHTRSASALCQVLRRGEVAEIDAESAAQFAERQAVADAAETTLGGRFRAPDGLPKPPIEPPCRRLPGHGPHKGGRAAPDRDRIRDRSRHRHPAPLMDAAGGAPQRSRVMAYIGHYLTPRGRVHPASTIEPGAGRRSLSDLLHRSRSAVVASSSGSQHGKSRRRVINATGAAGATDAYTK